MLTFTVLIVILYTLYSLYVPSSNFSLLSNKFAQDCLASSMEKTQKKEKRKSLMVGVGDIINNSLHSPSTACVRFALFSFSLCVEKVLDDLAQSSETAR